MGLTLSGWVSSPLRSERGRKPLAYLGRAAEGFFALVALGWSRPGCCSLSALSAHFWTGFCLRSARLLVAQTGEMKMSSHPLRRRSGRETEEK